MLYSEANQVITTYAPELLALFSDPWSRWPTGYTAVQIVQSLQAKVEMWYGANMPDTAKKLADVAAEIIVRAD